jgi:hypothetical protein
MNVESHGKSLMKENESHANYFNPTDNTETKALEAKTQEQVAVNSITPDDKIIFGHPGLGKTYAKEKGANIIVPDDDYNIEHKQAHALKRLVRQSQEDSDRYEQFLTDWWNRMKSDALDQGKQIINSNLPFLVRFPEDFDKVINMSDELFIERSKQRNDYKSGETESWKKALNDAISKIDPSKIVNTDKYLSDLLPEVNNPNKLPNNENNREYTPDNIQSLKPNEVFVFGSNAEGVHGKGAALLAKQKFGAIQGKSEGIQGQSYAIVTKKNWRVEKSSTLNEIGEGLADFFEYANNHPEKKFYMTKLGSSLAGYTIDEIKNQIKEVNDANGGNFIPDNVILPKEYEVRDELSTTTNPEPIATGIKLTNDQFDRINNNLDSANEPRLTIDEIRGLSDEEIQKLIDCN